MAQALSNVPVGALVRDPGTKHLGEAIVWQVASRNHQGYPANSTTLMSRYGLRVMQFDAAEAPGAPNDTSVTGDPRWSQSNLRQWLNSDSLPWFVMQHPFDTAPIYSSHPGFCSGLSAGFRAAILPTTRRLTYFPAPAHSSPYRENVTDSVFVPAAGEVGVVIGNLGGDNLASYPIFTASDASRVRGATQQAINSTASYEVTTSATEWWLCSTRTLNDLSYHYNWFFASYVVGANGRVHSALTTDQTHPSDHIRRPASANTTAILPVTNVKSSILVSDTADGDGVYTLIFNQPPTAPPGITVPPGAVTGGSVAVSWGASTDPEGDPITYELQRGVNGGAFAALATTPGLTFSHAVDGSMGTLQYRVRATDATGQSAWTTSALVPVTNNAAPVISGVDTDLGVQAGPPTVGFTVTDDTPGTGVSLDAYLDGVGILHEDSIALGQPMTVTVPKLNFFALAQGGHALIVTATDSAGESASRIFMFSRAVSAVDFALDPIPTSGRSTSIQVAVSHNAPNLVLQACNNALDAAPAWEAVTPGERLTFANTASGSGQWAIGVKVYAAPTQEVPFVFVDRLGGSYMLFTLGGGGDGGASLMGMFLALQGRVDTLEARVDTQEAVGAATAAALNPTM